MTNPTSTNNFYLELENSLSTSSADKRKRWAAIIIEEDFDIKALSNLLFCEKKIASRFSWLLSEIGALNPDKLYNSLPFLLELSEQINHIHFQESFATYWLISGVPIVNEATAIDLLFDWLLSDKTNVTTKSRSMHVLFTLSKKYPELKNELTQCIQDQIHNHSLDFEKKATKILKQLAL